MIYYYSGCGNSRFLAQRLSERLEERLIFIPDADRAGDYSCSPADGEAVGFVWPVYCWAPPRLVLDFIRKMKFDSRPSYIWFAATAGDDAGLTEKVFRKALRRKGLGINAAFCVRMPETYINIPGMFLDTKESGQKKIDETSSAIPSIAEEIASRKDVSRMLVGKGAWLKTYIVRALFYSLLVNDRRFHAKDTCTGCGICEKVCPLHNITLEGKRPKWNGNCTTCNSCYHHCPVNAIQFGKWTEGKGQYFFGKKL